MIANKRSEIQANWIQKEVAENGSAEKILENEGEKVCGCTGLTTLVSYILDMSRFCILRIK